MNFKHFYLIILLALNATVNCANRAKRRHQPQPVAPVSKCHRAVEFLGIAAASAVIIYSGHAEKIATFPLSLFSLVPKVDAPMFSSYGSAISLASSAEKPRICIGNYVFEGFDSLEEDKLDSF